MSAAESERTLRVTQVRSAISTKPKHRATLRALGLRGIGKANLLPDRPEIRGMLAKVPHLVLVEETAAGPAAPARRATRGADDAPDSEGND